MEAHNAAVSAIGARVKQFYDRKKPFRIYHGSTNSTRRSQRNADNTIDTSGLNHVLSVDTATKTALVEPNVGMGKLLEEATRHGLVPLVVMEFPGITVGGGFSGTSGESSSFRHGAFDSTVNSIEIVLPDGTITKASKTERQDLFWGAASAFGTLGVVTLLEVQLRDAAKYVQLTYRLANTAADALEVTKEECARAENDYVDGIVYSMDATIICSGRLTDELPTDKKPCQFRRRSDPWFYLHVEKVQKQLKKKPGSTETDYIPLADYIFRWDRGGFFVAKYAFKYFITPFNRITRYILDPLLHTGRMYQAMHKSGLQDFYIVQDVGVPFDKHVEFQGWLDKEFGIYPLWLCPLRVQRDDPDSGHGLHSEFCKPNLPMLMNFGVWGPVPGSRREVVRQNRALEHKVQECGGKKWLYAQAFYTEDEFWAHYDRTSYDALRIKYKASHLPTVYDKVKVDVDAEEAAARATFKARVKNRAFAVWPVRGVYGVFRTVLGGDYLLQKREKTTPTSEKPLTS
ncbi:Delta(24)-sterol reductase [Paramyrothecium foliicola]|nr:Delta(24)-sterol reductase [Paramyrothecium foliicola]